MQLTIERASVEQHTALYGIFALAGEHMHRALGLSHWFPFPGTDKFLPRLEGRDIYAVYSDQLLIGTFNLGTIPEPYYLEDMAEYWKDPTAAAMYFSGFAILPAYQQQGVGSWCMTQADQMVQQKGVRTLRFDAVGTHEKLVRFYSRLGYEQRGKLPVRNLFVVCFEKYFENV